MTLTEVKNKILECNKLPGDKAFGLLGLNRKQPSESELESARKAAVSIIFHESDGEVFVLLIKRTPSKGVHSAQMAFPGGRHEKTDKSQLDCAIRETIEEIGLDLANNIIESKKLSPIYIPPSNYIVQPFAFFIEDIGSLSLQNSEVQAVAYLPIKSLLTTPLFTSHNIDYGNDKLKVNGIALDSEIIWGATAGMLAELHLMLK